MFNTISRFFSLRGAQCIALSVAWAGVMGLQSASAQEVFRNSNLVMGYIARGQTANVTGFSNCYTTMGSALWVNSDNSANIEPYFETFGTGGTIRMADNGNAQGNAAYVCFNNEFTGADIRVGHVANGTVIGQNLRCVLSISNFVKNRGNGGGAGSMACSYNPTTGAVTTTATGLGAISECSYVCVDPNSTRVSSLKTNTFKGIYNQDANIGTNLSCARGGNYFYSECSGIPADGAAYNPATGLARQGVDGGCRRLSYSYLCLNSSRRACADGIDNDGDGVADANDPGCWNDINVPGSYNPALENEGRATTQCQDGVDNDRDGALDGNDFSCSSRTDNDEANPRSQCQDGLDNDADGLVDLADQGCASAQDNVEGDGTSQCQDGIDNDRDGVMDRNDPGCWTDRNNPATYDRARNNEAAATTGCQDTVDNDNDGVIDAADPGCWTDKNNPATYDRTRTNEGAATTGCQDGLDNDNDGVIDSADPGCWSDRNNPATFDRTRNNEGAATTGCQDGLDNDNDGVIDVLDPGCWTDRNNPGTYDRTRNNEGAATTGCQDTIDNDNDGVIDAADPGCWRDPTNPATYDRTRNNEGAATTACQDGIDNDGDTLIDANDPGCLRDPANPGSYDKTRNNEGAGTTACQDRLDNDGDGLIDLADPGCANGVDNNEVDEVSKLQVVTECVYNRGNGAFTAYFGYENLTGTETTVVTDSARRSINSFSPAPEVRSQVTTFKVGRQKGVVAVDFNGDPITWTVQLASGGRSTATASRSSNACKEIVPQAECIDGTNEGFRGTFGYVNENEFEIKIQVGATNSFAPIPADRAQPTSFLPGTNKGAFTTTFKDQVSWTVGSRVATATATTPVCPGGCIGTSTTEVKGQLDQVALDLAKRVGAAATTLERAANKQGAVAASKGKTDAARAKRRANQALELARSITLQIPAVVRSCPNTPPTCATVDNSKAINDLRAIYAQFRNSIVRIYSRANFRETGMTSRQNRLIQEARAVEASGADALAKLPRFTTQCS
jgi:hypothetical protein